MKKEITWLHLSDIHARSQTEWDFAEISLKLVRDLRTMQKDHNLRPDLVFITGDLAFGASAGETMADQYQSVRKLLDAIRTAFTPEIPVRNLYLVPGNHDVDRGEITPDQIEWLRQPGRQLATIVEAMRSNGKQWRQWMERLASYRSFLTSYNLLHLLPNDPYLIWGDAQEIGGVRVGVAGLNSAWSCAGKEEKAKLWFGTDWQISKAKELMGPVDFSFVLLHHPGNWFTASEDPAAMRRLRHEFAIVLHGHEHNEWVEVDSDGRVVLAAGSCYESGWMENGYSFGQIETSEQRGAI